jgi:hypothetical protein
MRSLLAIAVASGALGTGCCSHVAASPAQPAAVAQRPAPNASQRVPGEYLVTLAPGADAKAIEAVYGGLGLKRVQDLGANLFLVAVGEDPGPERMEALRATDARIQAVQPNFVYRASGPR